MKYDANLVAGVMLGAAAGDALGAGYEFSAPPRLGEARMIGGGLGGFKPGEWTDDTQMAVCILQAVERHGFLRRKRTVNVIKTGEGFLDWYASGPADVGNQTRAVLGRAVHGGGSKQLAAYAERFYYSNPDNSAGNGSLMRTAPVALAYLGNDQAMAEAARAVSNLTHADPLAGDACVLWCIAIDRAIRGHHLNGVMDGLALIPEHRRGRWGEAIGQVFLKPRETGQYSRGNGFVVTALQAALSAVVWSDSLEEGLQAAVATGGDTDTVAAIAGALLGARYGASAIPAAWRTLLHGWPGIGADDLARLALRAAGRGVR